MAKAPKKVATKPEPKSRRAKPKPLKSDTVPVVPPDGGGTASACCSACDSLPTGQVGMPWRDAAGVWHCLAGPTAAGSNKRVGCDENGFFLANP